MTKYRAIPTVVNGIRFASKREAEVYRELRTLFLCRKITKLEWQPKFKFPMGFSYVADFDITYADGRRVVIDVKGMETPVFKLKRKCMAYFHPDVALEVWR